MTDTTSLRELIRGTLIQCYMDHPDYRMTTTLIDDMAAAVVSALAARPPKPAECANGCPPFQVCDHCQWTPASEYAARAEPQAGEWVLVPREPTQAMLDANGESAFPAGKEWLERDARSTWAAMLAAAPSPASRARPEAQGDDVLAMLDHDIGVAKRRGDIAVSVAVEVLENAAKLIRRLAAVAGED